MLVARFPGVFMSSAKVTVLNSLQIFFCVCFLTMGLYNAMECTAAEKCYIAAEVKSPFSKHCYEEKSAILFGFHLLIFPICTEHGLFLPNLMFSWHNFLYQVSISVFHKLSEKIICFK